MSFWIARDSAIALTRNADAVPETVQCLGEGWVAEEALAIALFCALKAEDFIGGVRLEVNHKGDSDSTGAITGSILGTLWGKSAIPEDYLESLELREVTEQLGHDLLQVVIPVEDSIPDEPRGEDASSRDGVLLLDGPGYVSDEFGERYPPW
jgi:ADP-ribosylglycohydrolase